MNILSCGNELKQQGALLLNIIARDSIFEFFSMCTFVQISNTIWIFVLISFFEVYI